MSFKGSLESFSFTNILQMISLEKKTGLLKVEHGQTEVSVAFREGLVLFAERKGTKDLDRLKYTLAANKMLSREKIIRAMKAYKVGLEPLWTILYKYAPEQILEELLERQIRDCLFVALQWKTGTYRFDITDTLDVPEKLGVRVGVDSILMEGCRVTDEWRLLARSFPPGDTVVKRAEKVKKVKTRNEKRIMSYMKEEKAVSMLINMSRLGEFETSEAISALLNRGALEVVSEPKGPMEEEGSSGDFAKKVVGFLVPALALLLVLSGLFWQATTLEETRGSRNKEINYLFKEASRSQLDFAFSRLQWYSALFGEYPQSLSQLAQIGLIKEEETYDPWGNHIQYFIKEENFYLYSTGGHGDITLPDVVFGE